jgi:alpha-methylacyl-CoA racemase
LNLIGDFASGSLIAALGTIMALFERVRSGRGQVVDAAMVDGAVQLISAQLAQFNQGRWLRKGSDVLDGSAPFYRCYRCADGRWLAVGAIEPKFYRTFLDRIDADPSLIASQFDEAKWAETSEQLAATFRTLPRAEWLTRFDGADACVTPVLDLDELASDPHLAARNTIRRVDDGIEWAAAPRLSASPPTTSPPRPSPGGHTLEVLAEAGLTLEEIQSLFRSGAVAAASDDHERDRKATP